MGSEPGAEKELEKLRKLSQNLSCAACSAISKHGHGAVVMSANGAPLGIFVCHTCKSAHQSFSHLCKSVTMSYWTKAEVAKIRNGGNAKIRAIYMANLPTDQFLSPGVALPVAKQFVKACYIDKRWYDASQASSVSITSSTTTTTPAVNKKSPAPTVAFQYPSTQTKARPAAVISPPPSITKPGLKGHSMSDSMLYRPSPSANGTGQNKNQSSDAVSDLLSFDDDTTESTLQTSSTAKVPAAVSPDTTSFFDAFAPMPTNEVLPQPPINTRIQSAPIMPQQQQWPPQQQPQQQQQQMVSAFPFMAPQQPTPQPMMQPQPQSFLQQPMVQPPQSQFAFQQQQYQQRPGATFPLSAPSGYAMSPKPYQQQQYPAYNGSFTQSSANTSATPAMMSSNNSGAAISQMWGGL